MCATTPWIETKLNVHKAFRRRPGRLLTSYVRSICVLCSKGRFMKTVLVTFTAWKVSAFGVFLTYIFPHSDWIRRDTEYLTVLSPNVGKYGPKNLQIRTLFTQCSQGCRTLSDIYERTFCNSISGLLVSRNPFHFVPFVV